MGADVQWHFGTIRFGPEFKSHRTRDKWSGKVTIMGDLYDLGLCHLFVVAGAVKLQDRRDVLQLCRYLGYQRMRETRNGRVVESDLLTGRKRTVG